jgi:hypothetical protein
VRAILAALLAAAAAPAPAQTQSLSPEALEFMAVARELEPLHCERRKLRREILMAEVERRDARAQELRERFAKLGDARTERLEKRLGELERRIVAGRGGVPRREDLEAISYQQRDAFYRCE